MNNIHYRGASGFTLVELLISLLLGLMVLGAVGMAYIASKQTYAERDSLSLIQENGRIAIQQLEYGISPAGYPAVDDADPFIHDQTIDGASDSIGIKFFPIPVGDQSGYQRDCLGSTKTTGEFVENRFSIKNGKLYCEGSSNPGNPQPLAEGVDSMQIQYGVISAGSIQLVNATQLNTDSSWKNVQSVKIFLTVSSPKQDDVFEGKPRIFSTLIPLRNRIPLLR